jgi:hypothetical protein
MSSAHFKAGSPTHLAHVEINPGSALGGVNAQDLGGMVIDGEHYAHAAILAGPSSGQIGSPAQSRARRDDGPLVRTWSADPPSRHYGRSQLFHPASCHQGPR